MQTQATSHHWVRGMRRGIGLAIVALGATAGLWQVAQAVQAIAA